MKKPKCVWKSLCWAQDRPISEMVDGVCEYCATYGRVAPSEGMKVTIEIVGTRKRIEQLETSLAKANAKLTLLKGKL